MFSPLFLFTYASKQTSMTNKSLLLHSKTGAITNFHQLKEAPPLSSPTSNLYFYTSKLCKGSRVDSLLNEVVKLADSCQMTQTPRCVSIGLFLNREWLDFAWVQFCQLQIMSLGNNYTGSLCLKSLCHIYTLCWCETVLKREAGVLECNECVLFFLWNLCLSVCL